MPRGLLRSLRQPPICHTPVYGHISLIFGSFLPVNREGITNEARPSGAREGLCLSDEIKCIRVARWNSRRLSLVRRNLDRWL